MKNIAIYLRKINTINLIIATSLRFLKHKIDKFINYWPIKGTKKYFIADTSIILNANIDDGLVNIIYYKKNFDEKTLEVFKIILANRNNIVYDIGANIGLFSLLAAKVNNENTIYCFEPNPINFNRLEANIRSNRLKNINSFNLAVGNENKLLQLTRPKGSFISDVSSVYSSHTKRFTDFEHESFEVNEIKLDDLYNDNKIQLPSIIKLDVELFEYQVLMGAKEIISKSRPIVLCELHNYEIVIGTNSNIEKELPFNFTKKIAYYFKELNYTAYAIGEFGLLKTKHFEECSNVKNFLFLPNEPKRLFYTFSEIDELLER